MKHTLVLDDVGQPELTVSVGGVVFCRCSQGCSVSVGIDDFDITTFRIEEAETRHRLYVAVTETTAKVTTRRPFWVATKHGEVVASSTTALNLVRTLREQGIRGAMAHYVGTGVYFPVNKGEEHGD